MNISNDDFIRTTEPRHKAGAQELWKRIQENGHIYKGTYTGQYCVFDELYVDSVGPGAPCPECGRPTETVSEENYYFKLSAFTDQLLAHYQQNPGFIRPDTRRNEVIAFVKGGLRDLSISRSTFKWGVPVPGDPKHVMYVWLDALINYCSAMGLGSKDPAEQKKFEHYWPADVHMIGKEIIRFHCVYWPAFLLAAGLPLPKSVVAHGWLLFEESKMSKSRGNIVRAETVIDVMGNDALRYFLLREVVFGQDGSFSFDALVQRYNSDLANDLGNLSSRTLTMINRYFNGSVPYPSPTVARKATDGVIKEHAQSVIQEFGQLFDDYQFSRALESAWSLIGAVNKYLVDEEPWIVAEKEGEENKSRLATILYTAAEALRLLRRWCIRCCRNPRQKSGHSLALARSASSILAILSGRSFRWAASWAKWNRYSLAPTKLQSRGCNRWNRSGSPAASEFVISNRSTLQHLLPQAKAHEQDSPQPRPRMARPMLRLRQKLRRLLRPQPPWPMGKSPSTIF